MWQSVSPLEYLIQRNAQYIWNSWYSWKTFYWKDYSLIDGLYVYHITRLLSRLWQNYVKMELSGWLFGQNVLNCSASKFNALSSIGTGIEIYLTQVLIPCYCTLFTKYLVCAILVILDDWILRESKPFSSCIYYASIRDRLTDRRTFYKLHTLFIGNSIFDLSLGVA